VLDVHVELLKGILVHQQFDALTRRQLAALMLRINACLASAETRLGPTPLQLFQNFFHGLFR
jgi:hypothetical protein